MEAELNFEITLRRTAMDHDAACEGGCGRVTSSVLSIEGHGFHLMGLALCEGCQDVLQAQGIAIESAQGELAKTLVARGVSERLANVVARRWSR